MPDSKTHAPLTCVVADDHPALVDAISLLLTNEGITVVAGVTEGNAALEAIEAHAPDVAILDLAMPTLGGIEIARRVGKSAPTTACILYTGHGERQLLVEALDAGVRGFVLKAGPLDDLIRAVRLAATGQVYVDPALAAMLVWAGAGAGAEAGALSRRERDILRLLSEGKSNDQIAGTLYIAPETVRTYIKRAMLKLEADTRTQAVAIAIRQALIA
jgi:two-component system nitrate/nitrite response regulator NarL